jgi:hypothetical protein
MSLPTILHLLTFQKMTKRKKKNETALHGIKKERKKRKKVDDYCHSLHLLNRILGNEH